MPRVKIEDLKPPAKDLDMKEMKKLFGGVSIVKGNTEGITVSWETHEIKV